MIIATTTGTGDTVRNIAMVKNAIAGIALAKATGIAWPTVGILNVEGAAQERALRQLIANGYAINFTESDRADGGVLMRGNDMLQGVPDVMVTDSLTGNLLMKTFSSLRQVAATKRQVTAMAPVLEKRPAVWSASFPRLRCAGDCRSHASDGGQCPKELNVYRRELKAAGSRSRRVLNGLKPKRSAEKTETVVAPPEKVTDGDIGGVDILDIETARTPLSNKISPAPAWAVPAGGDGGSGRFAQARQVLKDSGFIA